MLNGGEVDASGDVAITATASAGTTALNLLGPGTQTVTHSGGTPLRGTWRIDKSSGSVLLGSNLTLSGTNQRLVVARGRLDLAARTLTMSASGGGVDFLAGDFPSLGITVADASVAGRITATGSVTGIANARLVVDVAPGLSGGAYTLVSNSTSFSGSTFNDVTFSTGKTGTVS